MIGAGNLATNLGKALQNAGHDIVQVYSRTWEHAQQLATIIGGAATDDLDSIVDTADVYIFSLKDSALCDVLSKVTKGKAEKLMIHTAAHAHELFRGYGGTLWSAVSYADLFEETRGRLPFHPLLHRRQRWSCQAEYPCSS